MTRRDKIEASVKNVLDQLIREGSTSVGALCTREIVKGIINDIDEKCTRKITKELSKMEATRANNGIDLAEVYSPPRMTAMARKLGYSAGFAMDLVTKDEDGKQSDVNLACNCSDRGRLKLEEGRREWLAAMAAFTKCP